jgi:hypothetical protein
MRLILRSRPLFSATGCATANNAVNVGKDVPDMAAQDDETNNHGRANQPASNRVLDGSKAARIPEQANKSVSQSDHCRNLIAAYRDIPANSLAYVAYQELMSDKDATGMPRPIKVDPRG